MIEGEFGIKMSRLKFLIVCIRTVIVPVPVRFSNCDWGLVYISYVNTNVRIFYIQRGFWFFYDLRSEIFYPTIVKCMFVRTYVRTYIGTNMK